MMKKLFFLTKSLAANTIELMSFLFLLMFTSPVISQTVSNGSGWHLTNYTFKDGSLQKESVLMGTNSKMNDVISYKGEKGNIEITYNRFDVKTGKMLAGVVYKASWTDPPAVLVPGEKPFVDFELSTISSSSFKVPQQSMHINQGLNGVYFVTHDGTKYITRDIKERLITEKVIEKGGTKRMIQMNFGNGFVATYEYVWRESKPVEKPATATISIVNGWHLTNYTLKDGSLQKESVLMGTNSKMNDVISYKGEKGNIEITYNRFDVKTGKMLAGVVYKASWTDPPAVLVPGEKPFVDFELSTISSSSFKVPQQSMHINQGLNGVYFVTHDGTKYITRDIKERLITEKVIEKGGTKRMIQMNFGNGFVATYEYEWREGF